jgi:hypothetical protein
VQHREQGERQAAEQLVDNHRDPERVLHSSPSVRRTGRSQTRPYEPLPEFSAKRFAS